MDGPSHPLTVGGLIWASAMVVLDSVRRGVACAVAGRDGCSVSASRPRSRRTSPTALGHGPIGAAVSAWPTGALVGSYELLMMIIRGPQETTGNASPETGQAAAGMPRALHAQAAAGVRRRRCGQSPAIDSRYSRNSTLGQPSSAWPWSQRWFVRACLRPGACARGDGVDGPPHPAYGLWAHLVEFYGQARLTAPIRRQRQRIHVASRQWPPGRSLWQLVRASLGAAHTDVRKSAFC
jgi:hypothetical protein